MYDYVTKNEVDRYRRSCSNYLKKLREILNEDYDITCYFTLIGSGANNLVTSNGNSYYDLDYNLHILSMPDKYKNNLKQLKDIIRNELNEIVGVGFSDAKDSRSVLTSILHFKDTPEIEFSFDIAILVQNNNGNWCRLIHNKKFNVGAVSRSLGIGNEQFTWNEVKNSNKIKQKATVLKQEDLWEEVRDRYLELKNDYLKRNQEPHRFPRGRGA